MGARDRQSSQNENGMQNVGGWGYLLKALWWDGQGLCLFAERLEKGRFVWPSPAAGCVVLTPAQLGMLLEGIDWRMPARTWRPQAAG
jgi:transposase